MDRSIVCGVDGTQASGWAARVAGEFASALDRTLVLVYVLSDQPPFPYGDLRVRELRRRDAVAAATALLERTRAEVPNAAVETQVIFGDPVNALMAVGTEEDAELLVVGSRGRGPLASVLLGSVSGRLAAEASCPVIVVPSAAAADRWLARPPHSRLVCGIDDSVGSVRALRTAGVLAERLGLELSFVHVDGHRASENAPAERALTVFTGEPVEILREQAADRDASLLVVGSRGRTSWRAALGSVSRELAASAPVPVMVVPPTARTLAVNDGTTGVFLRT